MPNFKTNKEANPEGYTQKGSEFYGYGNQRKSECPCGTPGCPGCEEGKSPNKLMGLVKKKVNKELDTPAGQMAAKAATGGMA